MKNDVSLEIMDLNDRLAGTYNIPAASSQLEIVNHELKTGVYFYHMTDGSNLNKTRKIVIMK